MNPLSRPRPSIRRTAATHRTDDHANASDASARCAARRHRRRAFGLLLLVPWTVAARASAPWGGAEEIERSYPPSRTVYDFDAGDAAALARVLDRVSYLNRIYEANPFESSIVVVVHGDAIPLFGIRDFERHRAVMERAQSLTRSGPIEFRVCRADAAMRGYSPADIHGFARMVPMADAEIVRLQDEGYAYLR